MTQQHLCLIMYPGPTRRIHNPFINTLAEASGVCGVRVRTIGASLLTTPDVLHLHWLEQVHWGHFAKRLPFVADLRARHLIALARKVRARDGRVVWTLHNLNPHETPTGRRKATWDRLNREFLPLVSDIVVMSQSALGQIDAAYPALAQARRHVVPHHHFRAFYAGQGVDFDTSPPKPTVPTMAMVGMLRPYKGIVEMIETLKSHTDRAFRLIIAGAGPSDYCALIRSAIGNDPRFSFVEKHISHADFAQTLREADFALFNFSNILNSGSVISALSVGTPVICPFDGALRELAEVVGPDWVTTFDRPAEGSWLLDRLEHSPAIDRLTPPINAFSPQAVASAYCAIYRDEAFLPPSPSTLRRDR
jgi:glycosyltransferase involved in cell wall biosynthesis